MSDGVGQLDDRNYPAITMGQAAELLGVQPAFLRSLDAAGILPGAPSGLLERVALFAGLGWTAWASASRIPVRVDA